MRPAELEPEFVPVRVEFAPGDFAPLWDASDQRLRFDIKEDSGAPFDFSGWSVSVEVRGPDGWECAPLRVEHSGHGQVSTTIPASFIERHGPGYFAYRIEVAGKDGSARSFWGTVELRAYAAL